MKNNNQFMLVGKLFNITNDKLEILLDDNVFEIAIDKKLYKEINIIKDKIATIGIQGYIDYNHNTKIILVAKKISYIGNESNKNS